MTVFVPSKICEKPVVKIHKAVEYDSCKLWVHIRCSKINKQTYNLLMENETPWYCIKCAQSIPPFNDIGSNELYYNIQGNKIKFKIFSKKTNPNQHILTESLNEMMRRFDNPSGYYYYKNFNKNFYIYNGTNILHLNINSRFCYFDDFHTLLSQLSVK